MYKIAIVGASSLLGRELKDALSDSPFAEANFVLLDDEQAKGQLDQVGDEVTFVQGIEIDSFERVDFTFFAGSEDLTRRNWREALRAGSTVLDLTGALDREPGVLVRAPWLGADGVGPVAVTADLFTPAVVPAHPAAIALALLLERMQQAATVRFAAATLLEPASDFGRAAMDELHQQTVSLLDVEARVRRHYDALSGGRWPALSLQVVHAPVFHGHTFSIAIELERPVEITALEEALGGDHVDLVLEDTDSPSNLAATGQNDVLVRLRPDTASSRNPNLASRLWLWAASDNLRLHAQNAVECALDLRRLRPAGTVQ